MSMHPAALASTAISLLEHAVLDYLSTNGGSATNVSVAKALGIYIPCTQHTDAHKSWLIRCISRRLVDKGLIDETHKSANKPTVLSIIGR